MCDLPSPREELLLGLASHPLKSEVVIVAPFSKAHAVFLIVDVI